jgi:hypothetical protein
MMKRCNLNSILIAVLALFSLTTLHACGDITSIENLQTQNQGETPEIIEGEYIVRFEDQWDGEISKEIGRQVDQLRNEILSDHNIHADSVLTRYRYAFKGFAARLSEEQVKALRNDPRISRVSPNAMLRLGINATP